jgi:hypothetical protein
MENKNMLDMNKDGILYNRELTKEEFKRITNNKRLSLDDKTLIAGMDNIERYNLLETILKDNPTPEYILKELYDDYNHIVKSLKKILTNYDSLSKEKLKELIELLLIEQKIT